MTIMQKPFQPLILVADDHPINRGILADQLEQLGLPCETAEDGLAALALWREGRFALVITDCQMPRMNGHDLAQAIRQAEADEHRPRTPILAWTDHAQGEESGAAQAAGMDGLLSKPIDLAQLQRALDKWLPSAGLAEASTPQVVDPHALHDQIGDDPHLMRQFHQIFQLSSEQILAELRQAAMAGNIAEARNAAHKLKSPARSIGAFALGEICAQIEVKCQTTLPAASLTALLPPLETELAKVNRYLNTL